MAVYEKGNAVEKKGEPVVYLTVGNGSIINTFRKGRRSMRLRA
jgi:hypothetical protein